MTPRVQKKIIVIQIKSFFYYTINGWYFECGTPWRSTAMGIRGSILGNEYSVMRSRECSTDAERSRDCNSDTEISGLHSRSRDSGTKVPMPRSRDCSAKAKIREYSPSAELSGYGYRCRDHIPVPKAQECYPGPVITGMQIGPAITAIQYRFRVPFRGSSSFKASV